MPALTILTCYYRPKPGGLCKRYFRGIQALLARGHTVHYLSVLPFPITHERCIGHRFPWPQHATQGWLFWSVFHLLAPIGLLLLAWRYRVDRIYSFSVNYAWMLRPSARLRGLRNRVFLRADLLQNEALQQRQLSRVLGRRLEALALSDADVAAVSQELLDRVQQRHPRMHLAQACVFPNDLPPGPSYARARLRQPCQLACVGILEPRKNPYLLLQVLDLLHAPAHLHYYGSGPLLAELQEKTRGMASVSVHGWVEAASIWPQVDLLLMPSRHEGAPNAVLEALAGKIAVLASDIPAHREILPVQQLLPTDDPKAWAAMIDRLIEDNAFLDTLQHEQAAAAQSLRFDWDQAFCAIIEADHPLGHREPA